MNASLLCPRVEVTICAGYVCLTIKEEVAMHDVFARRYLLSVRCFSQLDVRIFINIFIILNIRLGAAVA